MSQTVPRGDHAYTELTPSHSKPSNALPILVCFGYHMGFSSPVSSWVTSRLGLSDLQRDLAFALVCVGAVAGSFLAAKLADTLGRRYQI
jgi:MFS family permease